MTGYFWNTVLAINSLLWFGSVVFLTYGAGSLIFFFDWKVFLLSVTIFAILSLTELVFTALAHD